MLYKIKELAEGHKHQIAEWRHEFHANPELSFQEFETTKRIKKYLEQMGFTNVRVGTGGIETGVVADLDTQKDGPCIALRADIDALPMQEVGTPPYRSRNDGVMHACGHDSHIAMLLGAAYVLKTMESELPGKVRFIFQPSEESPHKSGARAMIQDGVLDGVDAISGLHIWSSLPAGVVGYKAGPFMASADEWECTVWGKGGHGAVPHLAFDPIVAASAMVGALQTIVSREIDPLEAVVITCAHIESGTTFNIIPDKAFMQGTVRTFNQEVRATIPERMERIIKGISEAMRCKSEFTYKHVLPPTVNDKEFTEKAADVARALLGADKVKEVVPTMGAEDMSLYLERVPGTFMFLGTYNESKGTVNPQHHPEYDVDDDVLPFGSALLASIAWSFLNKQM